ncbi:MAG: P-II family nitrogen regulator [Gudongella sp.]|jgi:nitrogen regulatory protein PII|nr:P-II family nitrogen regulator [Gudongella sp.]
MEVVDGMSLKELALITIIVEIGKGSRTLKIAKEHGITGGTVILADGTIKSNLLNFLGIMDSRREVIMIAAERSLAEKVTEILVDRLELEKPRQGIAVITPLCRVVDTEPMHCTSESDSNGEDDCMYQVINAIVDKGKAEMVIDAAVEAGSKGGTIINARGSGIHETQKVFAMEIEPEKEVVIIIAKKDSVEEIVDSISKALEIEKPGNGIIFIQNAIKTYGIYDE